jgi:hypothetical protein
MATIFERWEISPSEFSALVDRNPSLRGFMLGYLAEHKLRALFSNNPDVTSMHKDDDHDRAKKGDLVVGYKGERFVFEVKSLQTNSMVMYCDLGSFRRRIRSGKIETNNPDYDRVWDVRGQSARFVGQVQTDASDRRTVTFEDGSTVETTCLKVGEFDILAAGLFAFRQRWEFGFALNTDLERSAHRQYTSTQQMHLIKSSQEVSWPLRHPFVDNPFQLMDRLIMARHKPNLPRSV